MELWRSTYCKFPDDGLVKPIHVGAFIVYFNVNFNILQEIGCALVGLIKDWITAGALRSRVRVQLGLSLYPFYLRLLSSSNTV